MTLPNLSSEVAAIISAVGATDARELLAIAFKAAQLTQIGRTSFADCSPADSHKWYALDYLHNIIPAVEPPTSLTLTPTEAYTRILPETARLYEKMVRYIQRAEPGRWHPALERGKAADFLFFSALLDSFHLKRSRYAAHDSMFIETFLGCHDAALRAHFGVTAAELARGVVAVVDAQTRYVLSDQWMRDDGAISRELIDCTDLLKWPEELLSALSYRQGEATEFVEQGGMPLLLTPLQQRPLLRLDGRVICVNSGILATVIYRAVRDALFRKVPEYFRSDSWNKRQCDALERFVAGVARGSFPGARVFQQLYYRGPADKLLEIDVIAIWHDVLLHFECKAHRYPDVPVFLNFPRYVDALLQNVQKSREQCRNLSEQLERESEVALFSDRGLRNEVVRIRRNQVRQFHHMGIILDSGAGPATRDRALRSLNPATDRFPYASFGVEDLLAYRDVFPQAPLFVDFLAQRQIASRNRELQVLDELDHAGLYLRDFRYATKSNRQSLKKRKVVVINGTERIDAFYQRRFENPGAIPPVPNGITPILGELITHLTTDDPQYCGRAVTELLNLSRDVLVLVSAMLQVFRDHRQGPISPCLFGTLPGQSMLLAVSESCSISQDHFNRTASVHSAKTGRDASVLSVTYETGRVRAVGWAEQNWFDLPHAERERWSREEYPWPCHSLKELGKQSTGRNDACSCGSGKKFKKCCMASS